MSEQRSKATSTDVGLATKAIHAGYRPDPVTGAVNAPIYASSTFAQDGVGGLRGGFEYARTGNPTRADSRGVAGGGRGRRLRPGVQFRHGGQRLRTAVPAAPRRPRRHPR